MHDVPGSLASFTFAVATNTVARAGPLYLQVVTTQCLIAAPPSCRCRGDAKNTLWDDILPFGRAGGGAGDARGVQDEMRVAGPAFPLAQPPICPECSSPGDRMIVGPGNPNSNAERPYYVCALRRHQGRTSLSTTILALNPAIRDAIAAILAISLIAEIGTASFILAQQAVASSH